MKISASLLLALYLVSPLVSADIFKCIDAKGNDVYQNFPCPIDSIGSKATATPPPSDHRRPEPGMKMSDVRAIWGVPKSTDVVEGAEIWYYDGPAGTTRGVRFDRTGTVLRVAEATGANRRAYIDDEGSWSIQ